MVLIPILIYVFICIFTPKAKWYLLYSFRSVFTGNILTKIDQLFVFVSITRMIRIQVAEWERFAFSAASLQRSKIGGSPPLESVSVKVTLTYTTGERILNIYYYRNITIVTNIINSIKINWKLRELYWF